MKITPRHIGALTTTLALIGGSITFMQPTKAQPTKAEMSKTETTIQQGSQMFEKTALNDKVGTTSWVEESLTIEAPVAQSDPLPIPGVTTQNEDECIWCEDDPIVDILIPDPDWPTEEECAYTDDDRCFLIDLIDTGFS